MKTKLILLFALITVVFCTATAYAAENIEFTDTKFKTEILEQCDTNGDGEIDTDEAGVVTSIDLYKRGIESLGGIEYFTALEYLSCGYNLLTELDVSKNTALTELWCSGNQLAELDVSGLDALKELNCSYNSLTMLDVSGCTALETLFCYANLLTTLDVSGLDALEILYCNNNLLTKLDASDLDALKELNCDANRLTTLDGRVSAYLKPCTALTTN